MVLTSDDVQLRFIEGYNFRGPIPGGQLVQFDKSNRCLVEDFSVFNDLDPSISWPEDNISLFRSHDCIIRRGLLDGNNSESGVGVMFELSNNGLVEDVDTIRQGNGSFSAWLGNNITFRRTRVSNNFCDDKGRGIPSSGSVVWVGTPGSTGLKIEDSHYYDLCNPGNIVWDWETFTVREVSEADFQLRSPIVNQFPWETTTGSTETPPVVESAPPVVESTPPPVVENTPPPVVEPTPAVDSSTSPKRKNRRSSFSQKSSGSSGSRGAISNSGRPTFRRSVTTTCDAHNPASCSTQGDCGSIGGTFYPAVGCFILK